MDNEPEASVVGPQDMDPIWREEIIGRCAAFNMFRTINTFMSRHDLCSTAESFQDNSILSAAWNELTRGSKIVFWQSLTPTQRHGIIEWCNKMDDIFLSKDGSFKSSHISLAEVESSMETLLRMNRATMREHLNCMGPVVFSEIFGVWHIDDDTDLEPLRRVDMSFGLLLRMDIATRRQVISYFTP